MGIYQHEKNTKKFETQKISKELDQSTRAARAMAPAATTANLVVSRLEAPLLVGEELAADPEAEGEPEEPEEPVAEEPLAEPEPEEPVALPLELETGAGAVPAGFTENEELLA